MKFISICILSYNRPKNLINLLNSIDYFEDLEVIVSDDCSPKIKQIEKELSKFKKFKIRLLKNKINVGYDKNLNKLIKNSNGEWIIFMGDDDEFVKDSLKKIVSFLKKNKDLAYILKCHYLVHENGHKEIFRYFPETKYFEPSSDTLISLFRRSVYIAGFMINRKKIIPYITDKFDGSMLNQIYYLSEVVLKYRSAYLDVPFTQQTALKQHDKDDVMFDREKKRFVERTATLDISINFLKSFYQISSHIDQKYNLNISNKIRIDMSKYIYPTMSIYRSKGIIFFLKYVFELKKIKLNKSILFYIYVFGLIMFGKNICDSLIKNLKRIIGYTPQI